MIEKLEDLPAGVVGFKTSGKLSATDYRDVVLPALESAFKSGEVRFLIEIRDFDGMSGGALWQDLKMGVEHYGAGSALLWSQTSTGSHTQPISSGG